MVFALLLLALVSAGLAQNLPVVDLDYSLHRASLLNGIDDIYSFVNIRYAAPPVGDLRFRAPVPPAKNRTHIQDGSGGHICPQAAPIWETDIEPAFLESLLTASPFNMSTNISSYPYVPAPLDPRTSEDCLFLDVVVPKTIFDRQRSQPGYPKKSFAPVLVWIYGGGYVMGHKNQYDPTGLIQRSMVTGDGVIFVAMNYRLGAFGWLGSHTLSADGTSNAALYDQRLALDWIRKYIRLFGGDPSRVTVMGESAGGGSIMHQTTAYGGDRGPVPFQQAIIQSPGWFPVIQDGPQEFALQQFLAILNVSTIEEARQLPTEQLIAGNAYQIATQSTWGSAIYGPVVDGTFVPDTPGKLLLEGRFDRYINIMVGHNSNEGLIFTSPDARNSSWVNDLLTFPYPGIRQSVVDYITQVLYPPIYDGSYGYRSPFERADLLISDFIFVCNTAYLNTAYKDQTYAYEFSIPPGIHGQDVLYTFSDNGSSGVNVGNDGGLSVANITAANLMQDYFTSFAQTGTPRSSLGPAFPKHGNGLLVNIGENRVAIENDPTANPRCTYWQDAPYAM